MTLWTAKIHFSLSVSHTENTNPTNRAKIIRTPYARSAVDHEVERERRNQGSTNSFVSREGGYHSHACEIQSED